MKCQYYGLQQLYFSVISIHPFFPLVSRTGGGAIEDRRGIEDRRNYINPKDIHDTITP